MRAFLCKHVPEYRRPDPSQDNIAEANLWIHHTIFILHFVGQLIYHFILYFVGQLHVLSRFHSSASQRFHSDRFWKNRSFSSRVKTGKIRIYLIIPLFYIDMLECTIVICDSASECATLQVLYIGPELSKTFASAVKRGKILGETRQYFDFRGSMRTIKNRCHNSSLYIVVYRP